MSQENQIMRISGDVYVYPIVNDIEQHAIGPLPAKFSYNAMKMTEVTDTRKGKRGQVIAVVPEMQVITGELEVITTPKPILAMYSQSSLTAMTQAAVVSATTATEYSVTVDRWTKLPHANVHTVVATDNVPHTVTLTSLVVASNVATGTVSAGHGLGSSGTVSVIIAGATPTILNGTKSVTINSATEFEFAVTTSDVTATGTITASTPTVTYVNGTDYELNASMGMIRPLVDGALDTVTPTTSVFVSYKAYAISGEKVTISSECDTVARIEIDGMNDACGNNTPIICRVARARLMPKDAFTFDDEKPKTLKFDVKADNPVVIEFPVLATA